MQGVQKMQSVQKITSQPSETEKRESEIISYTPDKLAFYVHHLKRVMIAQKMGRGTIGNFVDGFSFFSLGYRFSNYFDLSNIDKVLKLEKQVMAATDMENVRTYQKGKWLNFEFPRVHKKDCLTSNLTTPKAVGAIDDKSMIEFEFTDSIPHAGIFGTTGAGKTIGAQSIVLSLIKTNSPDEMKFVMIDPNRWFGGFDNCSHLIMPIAKTQEEISKAIAYAYNVLLERQENDRKNDFRLVVMLDEGYSVLTDDKKLKSMIEFIANNGRGFKVNLIICSQDEGWSDAQFKNILSKLNNRFVGHVKSHHISNNLCGIPGQFANKLTGEGDFIHTFRGNGTRFQFALITEQDFKDLDRTFIEVPQVKVPESVIETPSNAVGRPRIEIDPLIIGRLMRLIKNGYDLSFRQTPTAYQQFFGEWLTRTQFEVNREALNVMLSAYFNREIQQ